MTRTGEADKTIMTIIMTKDEDN